MEWSTAQEISFSIDLAGAAKQQLKFLTVVDRKGCFYDGPILDRAIYRYNYCWLPLLAEHLKSPISEGPLVVPLDCEWIWHCHRLNPVQYQRDCEEIYDMVLDNRNVLSTVQGACTIQTEWIWERMYPTEPYHLDLTNDHLPRIIEARGSTEYDLAAAVKRQSSFFYKISGYMTSGDDFVKEAVARYKAFLYLIKKNLGNSVRCSYVPTRDIDLIWHSHQLHPVAYSKDLQAIFRKVLNHNDGDPKRSKGIKLDEGFAKTSELWEETFGRPYHKAGANYKGCDDKFSRSLPGSGAQPGFRVVEHGGAENPGGAPWGGVKGVDFADCCKGFECVVG